MPRAQPGRGPSGHRPDPGRDRGVLLSSLRGPRSIDRVPLTGPASDAGRRHWWAGRPALVAAAVLAGSAVLIWGPLHARLLELIASAEGLIRAYPAWGMVVFVLLAAVSA